MKKFFSKNSVKFLAVVTVLAVFILFDKSTPVRGVRNIFLKTFSAISLIGRKDAVETDNSLQDETLRKLRLKELEFENAFLKKENAELKTALDFKKENRLRLLGAEVTAEFKEFGGEYIIINRGRKDGLEKGKLVIDAKGAVLGKIIEVDDNFSKVSFASNLDETFETVIYPLGIRAIAKGVGAGTIRLEFVPIDAVVKQGDFVFLSRPDRLFLGQVVKTRSKQNDLFQDIEAVLLLSADKLKTVFVVLDS